MKKPLAAMAAGALALSVTAIFALPATAAQNDCPSYNICLWVDTNHAGSKSTGQMIDYGSGLVSDLGVMNDRASSAYFRGYSGTLYRDINYGGFRISFNSGDAPNALGAYHTNLPWPQNWNDRASSLY